MKNYNMIFNRAAARISALSSGKTSKRLPSNQRQTIEQAEFVYSP